MTEKVLGECWHDGTSILMAGYHCKKCDKIFTCNRTFTTEADMMELYRQIEKDGKWDSFSESQFNYWDDLFPFQKSDKLGFMQWLFCLRGEGYLLSCKTVAEFYGWETDHDFS